MTKVFSRTALLELASGLLIKGGLEDSKAHRVAELLIQTDEMGVTTHGVSILPYYLPELANGNMAGTGSYEIVRDLGATIVWDGNYHPGHWLMSEAIANSVERVKKFGVVTTVIRRSHHIGCLSVLLNLVVQQGYVCLISTSDPSGRWVAPFGGTEPVLTPNPWAVGYPTEGDPVLIDMCASITTVSKVRSLVSKGEKFEHPWMLDGHGVPTRDPDVVNQEPRGSILSLGGMEYGHKGFGLGLMVEMLTQGLSGHGRSTSPDRWGANVFLQVMDPEAFGGGEAFTREMSFLNAQCRENPPAPGFERVRIPGERALGAMAEARKKGIAVEDEILGRLGEWSEKLGVGMPEPVGAV